MRKLVAFKHHFVPWAGLVGGLLAAGIVHQIGSEGTFNDCASVSPVPIVVVGLLGLAVVGAAAWASWGVFRAKCEGSSRRLVSIVSLGMAALLAMAIVLPMIAALLIPRCYQ